MPSPLPAGVAAGDSGPNQKPHSFGLSHKANDRNPLGHDEKSKDVSLSQAPSEEDNAVPPIGFFQLFRYATKTEIILIWVGVLAAVGAGAAQPLMTLLFGNLTQQFVEFTIVLNRQDQLGPGAVEEAASNFRKTAAEDATYLVVIGIGMFICTYSYMLIFVYIGEVNAKRIRERYLKAILRQDIAFFDNVGAGEVATRIQTDTHLVQQGISEKVALSIQSIAAFITGFALAYARNWRLALAMSSMLPCIAIAGIVMNGQTTKLTSLSLKFVANAGSIAEEVLSAIRTTQAFGSQHVLAELFNGHIAQSRVVDTKAAAWLAGSVSVFFFVLYGSYGLSFYFGSKLINQGHATSGEVINVFMSILVGSFSLALLTSEMEAISHGRSAAAKLFATIERVPTIDSEDPSGEKLADVQGEIVLEHIKFTYPSRPNVPIIKDLSIKFEAGKTSALVGASGSGKSTVVSLIERFYDPLEGSVKLDGRDLKTLNVKWLRGQIGLVSQEPTLFATTIRGNVEHGLIGTPWEHASNDEKLKIVKEACIKANADVFISKLPLGYDTMVGERGFLLSGGQKQRIAIARAIVSDPRILLFDEATSALDTRSEGVVQDALDKASAGRTTITIAHRLSTIKNADVIYVFGEGTVLEQGTHNDLLALPGGAYARLVQAQMLCDSADIGIVEEGQNMGNNTKDETLFGSGSAGQALNNDIMATKRELQPEESGNVGMLGLMKRLAAENRDCWSLYGYGSIAAIISGLVYPAFGIVYSKGINGFSLVDNPPALQHAGDRNALWFFVIAIISSCTIGIQNYFFTFAAASLTAKLRAISFKAMLRQDIAYFDKDENNSGSLTSSLSENPQKVNGLAGTTLGVLIQSTATMVGGAVIGLIFAWKLGLVGLATAPFLIMTGYIRLRVVEQKDQANSRAHEDSAQLATEAAAAIRTVASLTRENDCCEQYSKSLEEPLRQSNKSAIWSNALYAFTQATSFWVIALIFWYGSVLVSRQEVGTFAFFIALMGTTFGAIQAGNVFSFVPDISSAKGAGLNILKLLDSRPIVDAESTEGKLVDLKVSQGHIRLEGVHFRYPTRPDVRVLRNMTLEVQPGTYIALVGASGCGKSTVIQLVERFYDPLAGKIYLDGETIDEINVNEYRKQIALVSQEPTLYAGTVRFNILLGAIKPAEEVTQEELEQACRDANILEFIQSLPDGFDTEVGGKGSQLSGGQKQRIAIARALIRNPKVLLLDEATSALDSNSEKVVQAALDQAAKGRTTIAIAHRLSTIQNADMIYFIKEGSVSEQGTHEQLLDIKGDYYEFVQLQGLSKQ